MVTHDLDSLHTVCDRIAVLAEGRVVVDGPIATMLASDHPWVKDYFRGKRAPRRRRIGVEGNPRPNDGNQSQLRADRPLHARGDCGRVRLRLLVLARRRRPRARDLSDRVRRRRVGAARRRLGPVQRHQGRRGVRPQAQPGQSAPGAGDRDGREVRPDARRHPGRTRLLRAHRHRLDRDPRRLAGCAGARRRRRPAADPDRRQRRQPGRDRHHPRRRRQCRRPGAPGRRHAVGEPGHPEDHPGEPGNRSRPRSRATPTGSTASCRAWRPSPPARSRTN